MIKPMDVTPEVIDALSSIRTWVGLDTDRPYLRHALRTLEETGVFAEIDEASDDHRVPDLLVETAARDLAEQHGARDHELREPLDYLRAVRDAQGR